MTKLTTRIVKSSTLEKNAKNLVINTYEATFGLNYLGLETELVSSSKCTILACVSEDDNVYSTLSIFEDETNLLPSNQLFNLNPPKVGRDERIVEIGRLAKSNLLLKDDVKHAQVISLLLLVILYAESKNINYWQATLHPYVATLLKEDLNLPFHIEFSGQPKFHSGKEHFENYLGTYLQNGMYYVWSDMESSRKALEKWNISESIITIL